MSYYMGEVIEDDEGELVLQLPVELLNQMGWDEETLLEWHIEGEEVYLREQKDA